MVIKRNLLWIIVLLVGVILAVIWYGFFLPDPAYAHRLELNGKLVYLWVPLIIIPLFYIILIFLVVFRKNKIVKNIKFSFITIFILLIITYPIMNSIFFRMSNGSAEQYHPYLQLLPTLPKELDYHYSDSTIKIFCLGGSTTEFKDSKGIGWPERLQTELRHIYKTDSIIVFNLGKQWYSSLHILINYITNLRKCKPEVIIVMENINDLLQNADFSYFSKGPFRVDYGHFMGPSVNIFKSNGLLNTILLRYNMRFQHLWFYRSKKIVELDTFPGLESYTRNISTLVELAKADSTKVILLSQPNLYVETMDEDARSACYMVNMEAIGKNFKWSYYTAYIGMRKYNDRIKEISQDKNVYFIDLESNIPKSLVYFSDDVHYTDTTFSIISKVLANEIVRQKIIIH